MGNATRHWLQLKRMRNHSQHSGQDHRRRLGFGNEEQYRDSLHSRREHPSEQYPEQPIPHRSPNGEPDYRPRRRHTRDSE